MPDYVVVPTVIDAAQHFVSLASGPWDVVLGESGHGLYANTVTISQTAAVPGLLEVVGVTEVHFRHHRIGTARVLLEADPGRSLGMWRELTLHELGHAVGLDHVEDPTSTMRAALAPVALETYTTAEADAIGRSTAATRAPDTPSGGPRNFRGWVPCAGPHGVRHAPTPLR